MELRPHLPVGEPPSRQLFYAPWRYADLSFHQGGGAEGRVVAEAGCGVSSAHRPTQDFVSGIGVVVDQLAKPMVPGGGWGASQEDQATRVWAVRFEEGLRLAATAAGNLSWGQASGQEEKLEGSVEAAFGGDGGSMLRRLYRKDPVTGARA